MFSSKFTNYVYYIQELDCLITLDKYAQLHYDYPFEGLVMTYILIGEL